MESAVTRAWTNSSGPDRWNHRPWSGPGGGRQTYWPRLEGLAPWFL